MSPVTHFLTGWVMAQVPSGLAMRERGLIALAATLPDVDGLGALVEYFTRDTAHPLLWFTEYHHMLHNALFGLFLALLAAALARRRRLATAVWALAAFHVHLLEDVAGARGPDGYDWPIPYLLPFSASPQLSWKGQWALNAWPNFLITGALLFLTFYLAWKRGYSPVGLISAKADGAFVQTLRRRFGRGRGAAGAAGGEPHGGENSSVRS